VKSKHNPNGGAREHFDTVRWEQAVRTYQEQDDLQSLVEVLKLGQSRTDALIRFHKSERYRPIEELRSEVNFKLLRALKSYDPAEGSGFTFLSCLVMNTLRSNVTSARKAWAKFVELGPEVSERLYSSPGMYETVEDLTHRVKTQARTMLTAQNEINSLRWYIESFCEEGFEARRHECANAAMIVHGLSHARSRQLHDMARLEMRRILYGDVKRRTPITPFTLHGTRSAWMSRYAHLMNEHEFTKFAVLMRNLSPYLVLLLDPCNQSTRADRCRAVTRANIIWILYGHPDAVPLFTDSISGEKERF
jgi:hypothetical protein